jgi:hypothetical protein
MHIKLSQQHCNAINYTLAGFELGIVSSVGARDGHFATPPGQEEIYYIRKQEKPFALGFEIRIG